MRGILNWRDRLDGMDLISEDAILFRIAELMEFRNFEAMAAILIRQDLKQ